MCKTSSKSFNNQTILVCNGRMSQTVSHRVNFIAHFIVWMRTAGLPSFRKLWGEISVALTPGTYQLTILNNYNVTTFSGHKTFIMSTTNRLGAKNYFLAISYIIVGCLCLVFAIIFFGAYMSRKNAALLQQAND
jgi:hypothetical protein